MRRPGCRGVNTELCEHLASLRRRDLEMRQGLLEQGRLYGDYDVQMQQVHTENARALQALVDVHGWPGRSLVGIDGARDAWLVAQHAIGTPVLQRGFLSYLQQAAAAGEVPLRQVACLVDRIRFNEGRAQVYGTVLDWDADGVLGCELEDAERVDARRRAVGLPPFEDSLRQQREAVRAEGGGPPADLAAYRRATDAWARQAGWR